MMNETSRTWHTMFQRLRHLANGARGSQSVALTILIKLLNHITSSRDSFSRHDFVVHKNCRIIYNMVRVPRLLPSYPRDVNEDRRSIVPLTFK